MTRDMTVENCVTTHVTFLSGTRVGLATTRMPNNTRPRAVARQSVHQRRLKGLADDTDKLVILATPRSTAPHPDLPCPRTHRQRRLPTMPSKSSSQKNRTMWKRRTTRNPCEFTSCVIRHSNEARCLQYHERQLVLSSFPSSHALHTRRALVYSHSFPPKTPSPASQTNSGVS